ncbi:serine/threonine protein kinase [Streptomyces arenae]|uniref:serine/threonine protein kinase n=1 Tax=Streptomyces arenae TaxID=29301 RepID=UPI00265944F3|nr:serine/threonine-protein kinase [Streptomyces arenae]MCG7209683.1 serine/threonine protein kinase [Streptomyces arenae]
MTMVKAHVSAQELVAGRYRLIEVADREPNRISWYAEDIQAERPRLVTQVELPEPPTADTVRRTTARILRSSEVMSALRPGRVAMVIDAFVETGTLWTVTELIDGTPLSALLVQQSAFDHVQAARIGLEVLDVLEAAHSDGYTHGELSPGQIFVRDKGPVVITGFGLAGATLAPRVTAPAYASPEQARDERIGPAADLWALGAILYTMVEGRPPFRDRGRADATLKGVDRLPLRTPLRAGPLTQVVQGLLRKNSRERLSRPVVRDALTRVLDEDPEAVGQPAPVPRLRGAYVAARASGWSRTTMIGGTALAVVTVSVAVLAATQGLPGTSSAGSAPSASATAAGPGNRTDGNASSASPSPPGTSPSPPRTSASARPSPSSSASATAGGLPAGFHRYTAPEGFSVALPTGWKRLETARAQDQAYRVTFGPGGDDPRTLAVTYSTQAGPDPVAVWRQDVEPQLERLDGYQRIGEITATTYQGYRAADMEWLSGTGADRLHTFGRGFLLGGGRSYSLRITAPAADWNDTADQLATKTFLTTFRA